MLRGWINRLFGDRGERAAVRTLKSLGYKIVARNLRNRAGEIDILALDRKTLVFVEVKTRQSHAAGHPAEAVDKRKQGQIIRAASLYLAERRLQAASIRFDVVAIVWGDSKSPPAIEHFRHAFNASDAGLEDA